MTSIAAGVALDPKVQSMLTKLGEAGGITALVAFVLVLVIRLIQKNGCTFKCYNCSGQTVMEVDCEEGAPSKRFTLKSATSSTPPRRADVVEVVQEPAQQA